MLINVGGQSKGLLFIYLLACLFTYLLGFIWHSNPWGLREAYKTLSSRRIKNSTSKEQTEKDEETDYSAVNSI